MKLHSRIWTLHCSCLNPCNYWLTFVLWIKMTNLLPCSISHPFPIIAHVCSHPPRTLPTRARNRALSITWIYRRHVCKLGWDSIKALLIITATGFRSLAWALSPRRCSPSGIDPPPAKRSSKGGTLPPVAIWISSRAVSMTFSFEVFSPSTRVSMKSNNRRRRVSF